MKSVKLAVFMLVAMMFSVSASATITGKHTLVGGVIVVLSNGNTTTINYNTVFETSALCETAKTAVAVDNFEDGTSPYNYRNRAMNMLYLSCVKSTQQ